MIKLNTILSRNKKAPLSAQSVPLVAQASKSIVISSVKPGSGKTLVAQNLAYQYAKTSPTILIDQGIPALSTQLLTQSSPTHTIQTIMPLLSAPLAPSRLKSVSTSSQFGFDLLSGELFPTTYPLLTLQQQGHLLSGAKETHQVAIVDFYSPLSSREWDVVEAASTLLMVVSSEAASLRATYEWLCHMRTKAPQILSTTKFVLNRLDRKLQSDLPPQLEKQLNVEFAGCIEEDVQTVNFYQTRGMPITDPTLVMHEDFENLAKIV